MVTISEVGSYRVDCWDQCDTFTSIVSVEYMDCDCEVFVPTAFSPNNDGENDAVRVYSQCQMNVFRFSIFNRWGSKVFETTDPELGWNGSYKGKKSPSGTYSFTLLYQSGSANDISYRTGTIHLLR